MDIKTIPLSQLEDDPTGTLQQCADTGGWLVIELPDHRLVSIQSLEPFEDDSLTNELLESNPDFQAVLRRSQAAPRRVFSPSARS